MILIHFIVSKLYFYLYLKPICLSFQPVSLSDREVISRLRNCLLALAAHKVLLYDTSVLYCYESSVQHQVRSKMIKFDALQQYVFLWF